ncbi:MAG: hypothetical protein GXY79_10020, partial [Chloroflexi bacterium]|nr:hypothetical protein [Chloroflexota bacterium]
MNDPEQSSLLEEKIASWRSYLQRRQAIQPNDVAELEDHLREQVANLQEAGLDEDEAFLVAVKRVGDLDALSREYALEHSDRLWKQLVLPGQVSPSRGPISRDTLIAIATAILAALLVKLPDLLGLKGLDGDVQLGHRFSLLVLPVLTGYLAWKRHLSLRAVAGMFAAFVVAGLFVNIYPSKPPYHTEKLAALHLPIALWAVVGLAYAGRRWKETAGRMDLVRFSGEMFIYYVLIALGGGVLTMMLNMLFWAIDVDLNQFFAEWLFPCGAAGGVIIAAWLVEAKQSIIENMAPVLTRLFTPLFALVLIAFVIALVVTGRPIDISRDVLIGFDMLLVVVVGLVLYAVSARDQTTAPDLFDWLQIVLVVSAVLANGAALWAMVARISEFGFSPNKVAALGENILLLVNLIWSGVLYLRFVRGRGSFGALEKWQTDYLPV